MRRLLALFTATRTDARSGFTVSDLTVATLTVNGASTDIGDAQTVADVVSRMGLAGKKIAVEKNGEIVPRSRYATTDVGAGDRLEIVGAVGGG
jgi:sulfur carrier protein